MSAVGRVARQLRFTNKAFWRNPASAFFTFAFPLMFLVIFTSILGGGETLISGVELDTSTYYVGAMAAFGVITACFTNIAISTVFARDSGELKRLRGTPLPASSYLAARTLHAMLVGGLLVIITIVFGRLAYDAPLPSGGPLFEFVAAFLVGSLSFGALAFAITAIIPNPDAAPPIVNAAILPLMFLSGIFIPLADDAPEWMVSVADIFPIKHFADAMRGGYLGNTTLSTPVGPMRIFTFDWTDVLIVAAWGLLGLVLAVRFFSWEPRK